MKKLITMSGVLIVVVVLSSCQMEGNIRSNESKANSIYSGLTILKNKQKKLTEHNQEFNKRINQLNQPPFIIEHLAIITKGIQNDKLF